MKRALITGITGQDGSYLSEFLLNKGYEVWGMYRRSSTDNHLERINPFVEKIHLVCADLTDSFSLEKVVEQVMPNEIYNLASQSHVGESFNQPEYTENVTRYGAEKLLSIARNRFSNSKFYQASTSELFGNANESPQSETTSFNPQSPYAVAKLFAHKAVELERKNGYFASAGILFNHESPRRGLEFVTRKITEGIARIYLGLPQRETGKDFLELGNLDAKRDWGYAGDYVQAMWTMLQQNTPDDFVIATGKSHSVKEFVEAAAETVGMNIIWEGEGINQKGYDVKGRKIVEVNPKFFRPREVHDLVGNASKARKQFEWEPQTNFDYLVRLMVKSDIDLLSKSYCKI